MYRKAASEASAQFTSVARVCLVLGAVAAGMTTNLAHAGGTNPNVVHGNVTFETRGNKTIIRAGDGSIINYLNFNIAPGEIVRFIQPGEASRVLNRITGGEASIIAGTLRANGHVYFVNPAGVFFNNGAVVNVNGLHAAAGSLSNARFLAGTDRFTNLQGSVVNNGSITANRVDLVGKHVANHGEINATRGILTMVAGNDVLIMENGGHISVKVDGTKLTDQAAPQAGNTTPDMTADPGVENTGTLKAGHGQIMLGAGDMYALAVRNSGVINASGGGSITVAASDGLVQNTASGVISADVANGQAGDVTVQGPSVLNAGAITADSNSGRAGSVEVTSQNHTYLTDGSVVSASGGDGFARGGEVLVHSYDGLTVAAEGAQVNVHGGALGGNGGFAEVSGKHLTFNATAQLDALSNYDPGTLLLDPKTIFITDTGGDDSFLADNVILFGEGLPTQDVAVSDEALEAINGDILLQALVDIYVMQRVDFVNNNNLKMEAGRTIAINERMTGLNNLELYASQTDATGHVFLNVPMDVAGKAVFSGTRTFLNGFAVTSGAEQEYFGAVDLCQDTTLTATFVKFYDTVDSTTAGDHGLTVRGHGAKDGLVTFGDNVGTDAVGGTRELEYLSVLGDSFVNGGLVRTKLFQTYIGDTLLGNNTEVRSLENGLIRFGGPLDGAYSLDVFTGGLTQFDGVVGGTDRLVSLFTDAPGAVQIGANMKASDFIELNDPARLVADVTIDGDNRVQFSNTIDGDSDGTKHDLLVKSNYTIFGSDATGLDLLTTDVDGLTQIGLLDDSQKGSSVVDEDVTITANGLDFNDDVAIIANGILTGRDFVQFHKTLNGPHHMDVFSDKFIYFGGDVGTGLEEGAEFGDALLTLDATVVDKSLIDDNLIIFDGNNVLVVGDINLNANGRNAPARVASIAARNLGGIAFESLEGNINFGPNEKFTSLGDLAFIAPNGELTIGDLNARSIFVDVPVVNVRRRGPGMILDFHGNYVSDNGTTIVVRNGVTGAEDTQVNLIGHGADPVFASRELDQISGPFADALRKRFEELAAQNFVFEGTVLDLTPPVFTGLDLGTAFAFPPTRIRDRIYLDPFVERNSEDLGLSMRGMNNGELLDNVNGRELYNDSISEAGKTWSDQPMVTTRLRRDAVLDALTANDAMFYRTEVDPATGEPMLDENGAPIRTSVRPLIKQLFADSWAGYETAVAAAPVDAKPTFMGYLANDPARAEAYAYATSLRELLVTLRSTGMTEQELEASYAKVLTPISPTADWHTFQDAVMGPEVAEQPVQARKEDKPVNAG